MMPFPSLYDCTPEYLSWQDPLIHIVIVGPPDDYHGFVVWRRHRVMSRWFDPRKRIPAQRARKAHAVAATC